MLDYKKLFPETGHLYLVSGEALPDNFGLIIKEIFPEDTTIFIDNAGYIHRSKVPGYLELMWESEKDKRVIATTQSYEIIVRHAELFNTVEGKPFTYIRLDYLKSYTEYFRKKHNSVDIQDGEINPIIYTIKEVFDAIELNFEIR